MFMPPHSNSPYTGVHQPSPYSPAAEMDGGIKYPTGRPHYMPSAEDTDPITLADGTIVSTVWTDDDASNIDYAMGVAEAAGVPLTEEQARDYIENATLSGASITLPGIGMGEIRATPLPSGHRVEEVTLEVPASHDRLAYALAAVENVINGRRAFGYTIPEESRAVTTIGNEIVIRWEEHS